MDIYFKNRRLTRLCDDSVEACKEWGQQVAGKVLLRITQLRAMGSLADAQKLSGCIVQLDAIVAIEIVEVKNYHD